MILRKVFYAALIHDCLRGSVQHKTDFKEDNTEVVAIDNSTPAVGSTLQTVDYTSKIDALSNDVHIIMFIVLFSFCWGCMKSWRTHSLKGVRK